ncbi:MAG: response regulator [Proteobacteria bacterium]|nr:response regulator [Pseudomonadota bacterium]
MDSLPTILIVDDESSVRELLTDYMKLLGMRPVEASNGYEALDVMRRESPDLVMTDVLMSRMDGIELLRRIKAERPETAVVVFTGFGSESVAIEALRAGARDYIKKPFRLDVLKRVVQEALLRRHAPERPTLEIGAVVFEEKHLELDNDPDQIAGAVNQLAICAPKYLNPERCRGLSVALHEIIFNAIEHGNLEISPEEKSDHLGAGDYMTFFRQRLADPRFKSRRVFLEYRLDPEGLHYLVRDMGPGFDWRAHRQSRGRKTDLLSIHGRGLLLASYFADRIDFNPAGNEARLYFGPGPGPANPA